MTCESRESGESRQRAGLKGNGRLGAEGNVREVHVPELTRKGASRFQYTEIIA
jgi:hypothetical protein